MTSLRVENPLVSIVTPSYNQAQFLEETILSVKRQSYSNIEHIIVDGASTDGSIEILRRYEGTYNMRWVSEPDQGQAEAVNKGFRMAKGEIVGWLNSDDMYADEGSIQAVVDAFQRWPDADVVYGDVLYVSEDGTILRVQCVPSFSYRCLLQWCFLEQPAVFLRRSIVESHQLDVGVRLAVDYEYWLRIGRIYRFYHLPRVLAVDRNHSRRLSISRGEELNDVSAQLRRKYGNRDSLLSRLTRAADAVVSGVPRRLKGLGWLVMARRKQDWTFQPKWDRWPSTLRRQLFARHLKGYLARTR